MSVRRTLITGADGFVGRRLASALAGTGAPLTLATRRGGAGSDLVRRIAVGDIDRHTSWGTALIDVDAVVHLAAHVHVAPERATAEAATFDEVNHLATLRLFESAAARGVSSFVFASSVTVLGDRTEPGAPLDDETPPSPKTAYARSKLDAERGLVGLAAASATRLVVLRPPLVCGPGAGGNLAALTRIARLPVPLPFGGIGNRRTLLAIDNLVAAIRAALDGAPGAGTYVLGDPHPLSTGDVVRHIRAGLGRPPWLFPAPRRLVASLAGLAGADGLHRRLFGDLEVDARGFGRVFRFAEVTTTATALREGAREAAGRGRG